MPSGSAHMSAELLERRDLYRKDHDDTHAPTEVGHIAASTGIISYLTEGPDESEDHYYFVGGLVSGAAYKEPACEVAAVAGKATLVRHANNQFSPHVLEADAREIVETIELFSREERVHLVGHSKGTIVAMRAVQLLDPSIHVASITFVNPVVERPVTTSNMLRRAAQVPALTLEGARFFTGHPRVGESARRSALKELFRRTPAILSETIQMMRGEHLTAKDLESLGNRPYLPATILAAGEGDTITPHVLEIADRQGMQFDATLELKGAEGSHFSIMSERSVMRAILGVEALVVGARAE